MDKEPKDLAMAYGVKKRAKKMCSGGQMMAEGGMAGHEQDADMIARIMHKRKEYSEGGMVANDDSPITDSMPAQYDDLVLRDELENHDTGANSGDMDGSKLNQEEGDMVSSIMKKRKGSMPRPA